MPMSYECALAFVKACTTSPKVSAHLEGILGYKHVPTVTEFDATNAESFDRADELISYFEEVAGVLRATRKGKERQEEIFPKEEEGDDEEEEEEGDTAEAAEEAVASKT